MQKERWLRPLMRGEIRSTFLMTEPDVASSDATSVCASVAADAEGYILNGRKWWSPWAGDPRCRLAIVMAKSDLQAERYLQQSMVLLDLASRGVRRKRMLSVFGHDDAPHGHAEGVLEEVRVPKGNTLLGEGRGFEIAQGRLEPARIHHCMHTIGVAEEALEAMARRLVSRVAFGRRIAERSVWEERVARARIDIEMSRLLCLKAADMMDRCGNKAARNEIAMIKVQPPAMALRILDDAIQAHGGAGVSEDFDLAAAIDGFALSVSVAKFPDQQSNPTYRLEAASGTYALRREPSGTLLPSVHAVDREYRLLRALHPSGVPVAAPIALCSDGSVIGAILARLHSLDHVAVGLGEFGKPGNYFRPPGAALDAAVSHGTDGADRAGREAHRVAAAHPRADAGRDHPRRLQGRQPDLRERRPRLRAVLDWELSTIGDPLADFAYFAMNWSMPADGRSGLHGADLATSGIPSLDEAVALYCACTDGDDVSNRHWYFAYNLFRLVGIVQGTRKRTIDGNASSVTAEASASRMVPLAEAAWREARMAGAAG